MGKIINLNEKTEAALKINEEAYYSFKKHESVGFTAEYTIDDQSILQCIDTKIEYHNPQRMKQDMPGADSATGTFIFKAVKEGTTILTVKHLYRGTLENEVKINVIVSK